MRTRADFILIALCCMLAAYARAGGPTPPGVDPLIPGRAVVRLPAGVSIQSFFLTLSADFPGLEPEALDALPSRNLHLFAHAPISPAQTDALEYLLQTTYPGQGVLVYGELLYEGKAPEGSTGSIWVDGPATASIYLDQYTTSLTRLEVAHDRATGQATVVAVLDTGIDATHPALAGRIAPGGFNFINNSPGTSDVGDGTDNDGDGATDELVGHGTYTAGLIALVAPDARLLPVTVLNSDGKGDNWSLTKGMFHAIDRGVEVINLSLTSTYDSLAVFDAVGEAATRGIAVVAAAGNWNREEPREYPAMDDDYPILGVAATDDSDIKGGFSNYNERLFISAPGASVLNGGDPDPDRSMVSTLPNGVFAFSQGTSMATPLVSGAAALVRSQHPEWLAAPSTLTLIRQTLASTSINIDGKNPEYAGRLGAGRVDVGAATELWPVAPRVGDLNNSGSVDIDDLLQLLSEWGEVHSSADFDGDAAVDIDDLLILISNWG